MRSGDPARTAELAGKVLSNIAHADSLIRELLDSMLFHGGHHAALELSQFDIGELVREVCRETAVGEQHRIDTCGETVVGWWCRTAMKRALQNMVGNAVKYGAPGTTIRIEAQAVHERLRLSVHNQGEPIPPEDQESIFQMFRRAEAAKAGEQKGWGIGLPYVRGVAERHGGSIALDSTRERGTTFMIDVPIDARPYRDASTLA